jgi:methylthioribose-1-phosphate isomerase
VARASGSLQIHYELSTTTQRVCLAESIPEIGDSMAKVSATVAWIGDAYSGCLELIDQTLLPLEHRVFPLRTVEEVWQAIKQLQVRGAPAIGVAAAYGVVLGCQSAENKSRDSFDTQLTSIVQYLSGSRPTAVNLFWALDRMRRVAQQFPRMTPPDILGRLLVEAQSIEAEDRDMCAAIGRHGLSFLHNCVGVLTHCNTGGLATAGDGTALSVIFAAALENPLLQVYVDETRPLLQGARLTAWELMQRNISALLICDSMAGWVMKEGRVQAVIVGADRIAANGDSANKIGTYSLSVLAQAHSIPFYIAAPTSTFDLTIESGSGIPIEQRASTEITHAFGRQTAPDGCPTYNPAFDVTPAANITAMITEKGVIQPVRSEIIRNVIHA